MRARYEHRQQSLVVLLPGAAAAIALAIAATALPQHIDEIRISLAAVALAVIVPLLFFCALTIRIDDARLSWRFGWIGWPRKSVPLADVRSATVTRTTLLEGWGVHLTRRGWLYNVAGRDAVLVTLKSGKSILLGTDEPRRLVSALERAIEK